MSESIKTFSNVLTPRPLTADAIEKAQAAIERLKAKTAVPSRDYWGPAEWQLYQGEWLVSTLCTTCRLGSACTHHKKPGTPWISSVDDWDLLPDAES